ncbi:hypothetical protein [Halomonas sp. HG01]|uniref:hypothetical protein n=1 Tax=Halomonas sp. HG01 TaxID=1609967 RepID=UPI0006145875|nr:hypothetical protein [Halomonas sp. HG01]
MPEANTEISLPKPVARAILELYEVAYSEGQVPDDAMQVISWINEHYPELFNERDFSHLPRE